MTERPALARAPVLFPSGLAIMALVLALVVPVSACPKFSNSTLSGSYVMTINSDNRSNLTDNPSSAGAVLGLLSFDSKGNFRGNLTTTAGRPAGRYPAPTQLMRTAPVSLPFKTVLIRRLTG
jgi:hypothetical protein